MRVIMWLQTQCLASIALIQKDVKKLYEFRGKNHALIQKDMKKLYEFRGKNHALIQKDMKKFYEF